MRGRVLIVSVSLLAGCMVGPDYQRPAVDVPDHWRMQPQQAQEMSNLCWWEQFGDPQLNQLIRTALNRNLDLAQAAARVNELFARYGGARAELAPRVDGLAEWTRSGASGLTSDLWQLKLVSNWEIDLWGRLRRNSEAAWAQYLAGEEARRSLVLSLSASVATAYIDLRNLDRQLDIARRTAASRKEVLDLFQLRLDAGLVSPLELAQVRSEHQAALAVIPQLEQAIAEREHGLSLLLGRNPGPIERGRPLERLNAPPVPEALPAEVLRQRPDIRQAEQSLVAANARIGVAKAAWFPSVRLTGALGSVSPEASELLTGESEIWNLGAPLSMPIFTAGRIKSQVETAQAQHEQALFGYRQTVLNAFREVENALVRQQQTRQRLDILTEQLAALEEYAELAFLRYEEGYASYIENLDAQRNLFNQQLTYAAEQAALLQSLVELYKAMGGGWQCDAANATLEGAMRSAGKGS